MLMKLIILVLHLELVSSETVSERLAAAKKALEYVSNIENSQCTGGTEESLQLVFNTSVWRRFTDPAVRTANILSSTIEMHGNFNHLNDSFFYSLVRNNVHGESLIYGSAIGLEPGLYEKYPRFCPYSFRKNGSVSAFDIAINYNYLNNVTEWYNAVKIKDFENATVKLDKVTYNTSGDPEYLRQPTARYEDGHWTYPYFDCGGGDIWMVTYSAPIFGIAPPNGSVEFSGVATIDIELTNVDINQCDLTDIASVGALDVFRGTHHCQETTKCTPLVGQGFRRGAYLCYCEDGYYYPVDSPIKAYSGYEIEKYVDKYLGQYEIPFRCNPCPRGCDTCVDATPCLFPMVLGVRIVVLLLAVVMIIGCGVISFMVYKYRAEMVIKTASPIFLHLMCLGAILMCCQTFVAFNEPTDLSCMIEIWPQHLGFSIMFGALLVKTWRISIIFSVGSVKRVSLPDIALLKRLCPLVFLSVLLLSVWLVVDPPSVHILTMDSSLKFFACKTTWWNYAMFGGEAFLLLFGVYLCFTVRKAPAHFNESKHITWAVYNAIILGSFIIILTQFMSVSGGPDILYLLLLAQLQVLITITMTLIFAPKFWTLYKGASADGAGNGHNVTTITGRVKQQLPTTVSNMRADVKSTAVQTDDITFDMVPPRPDSKTSKYSAKVSPLLDVPTSSFKPPSTD